MQAHCQYHQFPKHKQEAYALACLRDISNAQLLEDKVQDWTNKEIDENKRQMFKKAPKLATRDYQSKTNICRTTSRIPLTLSKKLIENHETLLEEKQEILIVPVTSRMQREHREMHKKFTSKKENKENEKFQETDLELVCKWMKRRGERLNIDSLFRQLETLKLIKKDSNKLPSLFIKTYNSRDF